MKMEDYLNSFYFRKATSRKIEDDLKLKMEEDLKKNGRRPQKMEDGQIIFFQIKDNLNKMEYNLKKRKTT
jgi:hypothetical protein